MGQSRNRRRVLVALAAVAGVAIVGVAFYELGLHNHGVMANASRGAGDPAEARDDPAARVSRQPASSSIAVAKTERRKSTIDWLGQFRSATDLRDVVRNAATAAVGAHDGRAAFVVYKAMVECADILEIAKKSPEALQEHLRWLADLTAAAPEFDKKRRETVRRCLPLTEPGLFEGVPVSESDSASAAFWRDRSSSEGDSLALMEALSLEKSVRRTDSSGDTVLLSTKEIALEVARSNDPEALFLLGQRIFADTKDSARMDGMALSLAVCLGGYDCTSTNPDIGSGDCDVSGSCTSGRDFVSIVQQSLPASQYATLYAKSQDILTALQRGDLSAVEAIVAHARLGGSP